MLKTQEKFGSLSAEGWRAPVYDGPPPWEVRDLAAHFYSAEVHFLLLARDVAAGGGGGGGVAVGDADRDLRPPVDAYARGDGQGRLRPRNVRAHLGIPRGCPKRP